MPVLFSLAWRRLKGIFKGAKDEADMICLLCQKPVILHKSIGSIAPETPEDGMCVYLDTAVPEWQCGVCGSIAHIDHCGSCDEYFEMGHHPGCGNNSNHSCLTL